MILAMFLAEAMSPTTAAGETLQQKFEAATAALQGGKSEDAVTAFQALDRGTLTPRTRSIVLIREGLGLLRLGRWDEALVALHRGLDMAPPNDAALRDDRQSAWLAIGRIHKASYDYDAARGDFQQAGALADTPETKIQALLAFASVAMFDDAPAALAAVSEADAIATGGKMGAAVRALIHDARGRISLNQHDPKTALADFQKALQEQGGLKEKTSLQDVMVRSDVALAYVAKKQPDLAQEYFYMTGEGRVPSGPFAAAARMDLAPCGGDLHPEDDAVVEFGIAEDGSVAYADPIYASRPGPVGRELARAVSQWSWRPGDVEKIPPFYRAVTRVEVKCSNATQKPADPDLLLPEVQRWLADKGVSTTLDFLSGSADRGVYADLRKKLDTDNKDRPVRTLADLLAFGMAPDTDFAEQKRVLARAADLADSQHAPPAVVAYLRLAVASRESMSMPMPTRRGKRPAGGENDHPYRDQIDALLARADFAADARTSAVLWLIKASIDSYGDQAKANAALEHVTADARIEAHDPLKVGAYVRLASLLAAEGRLPEARAAYERSGLDAQQCSLVDARPALTKTGVGEGDYPMDMLMMSVSGWASLEFDILPSGETTNRRSVISFPPYVFGDATVQAMAKTRYTQSYRPGGELGCSGASLRFHYLIPSH